MTAFMPGLAEPQDDWAATLLRSSELELYLKMDARDRAHACRVARALLKRRPEAPSELVRAALLHDVGKSLVPYRAWQRILLHLWRPTLPPEPEPSGFRRTLQVHRHHARLGADMVRAAAGAERVAQLIERHHAPGTDAEARLLKEIEELY